MTLDPRASDPRFRRLCERVKAAMAQWPVPGVAFGILCGEKQFTAAFGVTSVENPLPVTDTTLFQVGSITKTFTATALLRLVEMGRLALDEPLRTYLPDLCLADEDVAARVTLRHLLTHTGGWEGDYFNDYGPERDALQRIVADLVRLKQLTPLGELWSYNNAGFYLAGRLLEVASGQPYEQALQALLTGPLGLQAAYFFPHDLLTYRFAAGHEVVDGQPRVARPWWIGRAGHAIGGLVTHVGDLLRYARFHLGDGRTAEGVRLLSAETLALMQTPQVRAGGREWMGLSWFILPQGGRRVYRHGGATNGMMANLTFVPDAQFACVLLANSDDAEQLIYGVRQAALQAFTGIELPGAVPTEVPAGKLAEYVGRYDAPAQEICLSLKEGRLELAVRLKGGFPTPDAPPPQSPPPARAALYEADRLVVLEGIDKDTLGDFLRSAEGNIAWLRIGGRVHKRLEL